MKKTGTARFRRSREKCPKRVPAASGAGARFSFDVPGRRRHHAFPMRKKCPPPNSAALSRRAKIAAAALCVFSGVPALFAERTQFTPYSSDDGRYGEITVNPWYGDKELSGGMTSAGGTFLVRFGEYIVYDGDYSYDSPRTELQFDSKANSAFLRKFSDSVMRALNTVESTFANKATTPILINCTFAVRENRAGAAANPNLYRSGYKTTWTESDFGGKYAGTPAYINDVEMIYKYGDDRSFANCAVDFTFYAQSMSAFSDKGNLFYAEEDPSGYANGEYDVETITLHELGHALGFQRNATGGGADGKSSLELMTVSQESSLPGGGTEWFFEGETATFVNGGERVEFMPGSGNFDPHVRSPAGDLMADGTYNPGVAREYSLLDLAVFQDLGWTLSEPIPAVPEPSAFGLFAGTLALAFAASSRRRGKRA